MTRQELRDVVGQFINVAGWLCLGFGAASGLRLFLIQQPTRSKGGGPEASYEIWILFAIPLLLALSAPLIFLSRRPARTRATIAYWCVLLAALIPWLIALVDFWARGDGFGFQHALKASGIQ